MAPIPRYPPRLIEVTKGLGLSGVWRSGPEERTLGSTKVLSTTTGTVPLRPLERAGFSSRTSVLINDVVRPVGLTISSRQMGVESFLPDPLAPMPFQLSPRCSMGGS